MRPTLFAFALTALLAAGLLEPLRALLPRFWTEEGCYIDPSGRCLPGTAGAPAAPGQGDEGCRIDPSGRCGA